MTKYWDRNNNKEVESYTIGSDDICVQFNDGRIYVYSYQSAGSGNVEHMKKISTRWLLFE